jgi:hypothetical protein
LSWTEFTECHAGLHHDDQSQHEERLKLWNDFNNGWLALAFQQSQLMTSGQDASSSQRLMTKDQIEEMGDELVRLCDGLERHGLVDYQYGVWEEQIEAGMQALDTSRTLEEEEEANV